MPAPQGKIQIGKSGVTENFMKTLKTYFKKYKTVRIRVLKNAGHNKASVKKMTEDILKFLGERFRARIIGFVIVVQRS